MPRCLEPGDTFDIWLDFDADRPLESRPVFVCKTLSVRQCASLSKAFDAVFENASGTFEDLHSRVCEELCKVISGWRNMGGREFSHGEMLELLTSNEIFELVRKIIRGESLSTEEKKS